VATVATETIFRNGKDMAQVGVAVAQEPQVLQEH
jgi:hypothetical protein